ARRARIAAAFDLHGSLVSPFREPGVRCSWDGIISPERRLPMAHVLDAGTAKAPAVFRTPFLSARPAYQAYVVLYAGYVALPILAGLDKFAHLLVNWDMYLGPVVTQILPVSAHTFMLAVGVIEIAAGLLVALYPRVGAYVVALWLWGII